MSTSRDQPKVIKADDLKSEFLICPICNEDYDDDDHVPLELPCRHVLCSQCLERISKTGGMSAFDRRHFRIPRGGVYEFPVDKTRQDLLEFVNGRDKSKPKSKKRSNTGGKDYREHFRRNPGPPTNDRPHPDEGHDYEIPPSFHSRPFPRAAFHPFLAHQSEVPFGAGMNIDRLFENIAESLMPREQAARHRILNRYLLSTILAEIFAILYWFSRR